MVGLAVHFGGGCIGRGFFAKLLYETGYEIVFVDFIESTIKDLQQTKSYTVTEVDESGEKLKTITNYRAINFKHHEQDVIEEISKADIVTCAIGLKYLKFIAPLIAKAIKARTMQKPLAVIACENTVNATDTLAGFIKNPKNMDEATLNQLPSKAEFGNSAIDHIVLSPPGDTGLNVDVESFYEWCVETTGFRSGHPEIKGAHWVNNLEPYVERQLFTVNTSNATAAYYGHYKGIRTIHEALANREINRAVHDVLKETSQLIVSKHGFNTEEQAEYVYCTLVRIANPYLEHVIGRANRAPLRDLSREGCFIGPAAYIAEKGGKVDSLLKGVEMALRFQNVDGDPESAKLATLMSSNPAAEATAILTGLERDHPLFKRVVYIIEKVQDTTVGEQRHIIEKVRAPTFREQQHDIQKLTATTVGEQRQSQTQAQQDSNPDDSLLGIGRTIIRAFPAQRRIEGRHYGILTAKFVVQVGVRAFLDWYYGDDSCQTLGTVITLTGSAVNAQAVTCQQYMEQTWPSSGRCTLRAIQNALIKHSGHSRDTLPDGTPLETYLEKHHLNIRVRGTPTSIAEVGEQLAWLGAALQMSTSKTGMAYTTPHMLCETSLGDVCNFQIIFKTVALGKGDPGPGKSGCCWHSLFQNHVIIQGYPIPNRLHNEEGLEISIDLMAGLGNADYLTKFGGLRILKGFSTMFVATKRFDESVVWHFLWNKNGERISYGEASKYRLGENIGTTSEITTWDCPRNFVGWATSVKTVFGTSEACYDKVGQSSLSYCSGRYMLDSLTITAGKYVTVSGTIKSAVRNPALSQTANWPYDTAIEHARLEHYVNIFDVEEGRGWLLDGASALLQLTCTQLSHKYSPHRNMDASQALRRATSPGGAQAAAGALKDRYNRNLVIAEHLPEIYEEQKTDENGKRTRVDTIKVRKFLFSDLVRNNWEILQQMADQLKVASQSKWTWEFPSIRNSKIEGWDFLDLARGGDLAPRVYNLKSSSGGWVDFTRAILTINLLGKSFGPIIQPVYDDKKLCMKWKQVPTKRDLLTTCVPTIHKIWERFGNNQAKPLQVLDVQPTLNPVVNRSCKPFVTSKVEPTLNPIVNSTGKPFVSSSIKLTLNPIVISTVNPIVKPFANPSFNAIRNPSLKPSKDRAVSPTTISTEKSNFKPSIDSAINPTVNTSINSTVKTTAKSTIDIIIRPIVK